MRDQDGACRQRSHRTSTMACRAHLSSFVPAGRCSSRCALSNPAERASFHGKGLRADTYPACTRNSGNPAHHRTVCPCCAKRYRSRVRRREVHAANGYLIDQFLQDRTNKRTDQYGGSIENRSRFLMEVVGAVTAVVGAERTGVRISPQNTMNDIADRDPQALFNYVAEHLAGKGLAYLHIIVGDTSGKPVPPFDYTKLKRLFGGLVIANNGFNKERANKTLAEGRADLIAFGTPFIANPDLVIRLFLDAPLLPVD